MPPTFCEKSRRRFASASAAPNFDRFFEYDHEGRIANALTGSESHGIQVADGPFRQSYGYDVWENTSSRTYRLWTQSTQTEGPISYPNNRHQNWGYDNSGNVTGTYDANFAYDAAGRNYSYSSRVTVNDLPALEIAQTFDGNSAPASKVETQRTDPNAPASVTTTYYLRSTTLGGKVVAELDSAGYKRKGYIYAGGMQIAQQDIFNPGYGSQVSWTSASPATGSEYITDSSQFVGRKELDPLGTDVTAPPTSGAVEPTFYNPKFDQMPVEIETGPSADHVVDDWYVNTVNKDFDRQVAETYWQHGFRDVAQQIVAKNPNVGVEYNVVGFEKPLTGSVFGAEAADLLNGLSNLLDQGYIVSAGSARRFVQQKPAEPQQQWDERNKADIQIDTITYLQTINGLKIRLLATVQDSRYQHFNWVQFVTTNLPLPGDPANEPVIDRDTGQLTPFYWNPSEQTEHENDAQTEGGSTIFVDNPSRHYWGTPVYWRAKLYLVGIRSNGTYDALLSYSYGFTMDANGVHLQELRRIR